MKKEISSKIAICIADHDGKILSQNEACTSLCPTPEGAICKFLSTSSAHSPEHQVNHSGNEGMVFHKCHTVGDMPADVVTINDGTTLTTLFYPLSDHIHKQISLLKEYGLSKRELEVAYLMLNGRSNDRIAKELFISKPTLKTHINSIYKKIPQNKIHILKTR